MSYHQIVKSKKNIEKDPHAAILLYHFQSGLLKEFEAPKSDLKIFSDEPSPDGEEKNPTKHIRK